MSQSVFDRVEELLRRHGVPFGVLRHEPVYTGQQAADIRGTSLASGAKALVCKGDDQFVMIVLPADLKLDSKAVRRCQRRSEMDISNRPNSGTFRTAMTPFSYRQEHGALHCRCRSAHQ